MRHMRRDEDRIARTEGQKLLATTELPAAGDDDADLILAVARPGMGAARRLPAQLHIAIGEDEGCHARPSTSFIE